jgi:hypothetical protein
LRTRTLSDPHLKNDVLFVSRWFVLLSLIAIFVDTNSSVWNHVMGADSICFGGGKMFRATWRRAFCNASYVNRIRLAVVIRTALLVAASAAVFSLAAFPLPAHAIPSFARQTGQPCATCHVDFPQLTPFGRRFKLGGYTAGGGENSSTYKKVLGSNQKIPPISVMGIVDFTHVQNSHGDPNDQLVADEFSVFYGGAITENLGAFVQGTLEGGPNYTWDNADVRYVKSLKIGNADVLLGVTAHNNPTVQDVWNTLPAWGYPFKGAEGPGASTVLEGAFEMKVGGVGAYAFINNWLYLEVTGYKQIRPNALTKLGVDPLDAPGLISGISPYFRIAAEPNWGNHWLELGAFAFMTKVNPFDPNTDGSTFSETDRYTDFGFDTQYQYLGENHVFTLRAVYINEKQKLDASAANGLAANSTNWLNTFKAQASLAVGTINRFIFTGGYFNNWGSADATLYADNRTLTPNTDGWIAEIAYTPFNAGNATLWPWYNARIGLQYTWYNKANGASTNYDNNGANARDNNTLFAYLWFAM